MLIQKPLFYLLIFSLFLNISSCKKVFDKDYYKDCVGESEIFGDAIGLIRFPSQMSALKGHANWGYYIKNSIECNFDEICDSVGVIKKDSLEIFKQTLLLSMDQQNMELTSLLQSLDSSEQSVIGLPYFYYPDPSYPFYFVSNKYHVIFDELKNELSIFFERRVPTKGKEKQSLTLEKTGCYIIVDKVIDENTKLTLTYFQNKCN